MDYICGKFGDYGFNRVGSIVRTNRHRQPDENERNSIGRE